VAARILPGLPPVVSARQDRSGVKYPTSSIRIRGWPRGLWTIGGRPGFPWLVHEQLNQQAIDYVVGRFPWTIKSLKPVISSMEVMLGDGRVTSSDFSLFFICR